MQSAPLLEKILGEGCGTREKFTKSGRHVGRRSLSGAMKPKPWLIALMMSQKISCEAVKKQKANSGISKIFHGAIINHDYQALFPRSLLEYPFMR